ncbi:MAG: OadG family protein [Desulfosarcina sp.]|nr:OadG family protein [Desulfobacterales bacterium]
MYGLEAISNNNGWIISGAGILIVFACLASLSFAVSQIKVIFILFDRSNRFYKKIKSRDSKKKIPEAGTAAFYELLKSELEEPFQLFELLEILDKNNFPHPYLTVNQLRYGKTIIPSGDGCFIFKRNEV